MKPGQKEKVNVPEDEVLHLSQVCLHDPKPGKNYLQVSVADKTLTFCCLEKDKCEHNSLDLFFGPDAPTFINKGTSEVHLSGYLEPMDDDGEDDEGAEAPKVAVKEAKASPKTGPAKAEPAKTEAKKASPKAAAKVPPAAAEQDDEDDDEEDEEEEEGGEEEEMEKDEEEPLKEPEDKAAAAKQKAALEGLAKRKAADGAQSAADKAAPPAKKAKAAGAGASPKASPKAAPAASPKAGAAKDSEYVQQLTEFLKAHGKTRFSDLGSKVKRPPGVPKMKNVIDANKDKFVVVGDSVELKK